MEQWCCDIYLNTITEKKVATFNNETTKSMFFYELRNIGNEKNTDDSFIPRPNNHRYHPFIEDDLGNFFSIKDIIYVSSPYKKTEHEKHI